MVPTFLFGSHVLGRWLHCDARKLRIELSPEISIRPVLPLKKDQQAPSFL